MWLLLLVYFVVAVFFSAVNFSLLKGKRMQWIAIVIPGTIVLFFYNFSIAQNNQTLDWLINQPNLVSGIAILQTFEAIIFIVLTVIQIKSFYKSKFPNLWKWIAIIPSIQMLIGLVFFQTYFFLQIDGISFLYLALFFFLGTSAILALLTFSIQKVIKTWAYRAELKALAAMFQLLLAMFLPLIARGQKVSFTQITIDYQSILFTTALVVFIATIGYVVYKRKNKNI
ncbi:MAG: hypothetical protein V3U92_07000 [Cellulophaga sp.]